MREFTFIIISCQWKIKKKIFFSLSDAVTPFQTHKKIKTKNKISQDLRDFFKGCPKTFSPYAVCATNREVKALLLAFYVAQLLAPRDSFCAGCKLAAADFMRACVCVRVRFLPQVVPATEDEVGFRVEGGAHLPQAAVAAGTFETVLVPVFVQGLEQVAVFNLAIAASAPLLFPFGLDGEHRHTCSDKETKQPRVIYGPGPRVTFSCSRL